MASCQSSHADMTARYSGLSGSVGMNAESSTSDGCSPGSTTVHLPTCFYDRYVVQDSQLCVPVRVRDGDHELDPVKQVTPRPAVRETPPTHSILPTTMSSGRQ